MASQTAAGRILVVEDDPLTSEMLCTWLAAEGHTVDAVDTAAAALEHLETRAPEVVLLDLGLPDEDGIDLLPKLKDGDELISVIILTGQTDTRTVVEAMLRGADNFLPKPVTIEVLLNALNQTLERHRALLRVSVYRAANTSRAKDDGQVLSELVGTSDAIKRVRDLVAAVAETDSAVVLHGETGTGKDIVARGIHRLSKRAAGPFTHVNCASLPEALVESELFGHEKGAFTGAANRKPGLLEVANGGTVFLDEIAELNLPAQSKLLKAVETQSFRRVGGVREISTDVRFIVATHRDLDDEVSDGRFRADLFYRLSVFRIDIPPLRERRGDDILELARHFIQVLNPLVRRNIMGFSPRAEELLLQHAWPGNARELRNVVESAMIRAGESTSITPIHLSGTLRPSRAAADAGNKTLTDVEGEHIRRVLEHTDSNIQRAAKILGISRSTLYSKLNQLGLR
ncbi:MAG: sigma-54-dependent transcriptional regulator [Thermoanaerobaculales bacterium]